MHSTEAAAQSESLTTSRPTTSGWGKCTETVKTLVPIEFREAMRAHWLRLGYQSEGDFVREQLMVAVLGEAEVTRLHTDRISALGRNLSGIGTRSGA